MIKEAIKKFAPKLVEQYRINQGAYVTLDKLKLDKAERVLLNKPLPNNFKVGLVPEEIAYNRKGYYSNRDYTPRYERFLRNNLIDYELFDIRRSDWIEKAQQYDLIVWHTSSDIQYQRMAKDKIYFLEHNMGKRVFPSFDAVWGYENKINSHYIYMLNKLPEIPTFVTFDKDEALEYIEHTKFPIISKVTTGSASRGVEKLETKAEAKKFVAKVFSYAGRRGHCPYENQKGYVYFQQFVDTAKFDLRIIVVGEKIFGYYRYPNKGDFRASGAGNYEKKAIPAAAMDLAYKVKQLYNVPRLAIDLLQDSTTGEYYIIETSIFIGIDTCEQLVIDGVPGYYKHIDTNQYEFHEGRYWMQELELFEVLNSI